MWHLQLLMALIGVSLVRCDLAYDDLCYLHPHNTGFNSTKQIDLEIPDNCTYGVVDWDYPRGVIHMHMERTDGPYSLCIEATWGTIIGGLKELRGGVETTLNPPEQGTPSCTKDKNGKTELLISAYSIQVYMTNFAYRAVPREAS